VGELGRGEVLAGQVAGAAQLLRKTMGLGGTQAVGEPCARDLDCGDLALCCDHACAAVDDCEPAPQTGDGTTSSSTGGELPTTGDGGTTSGTSTGPDAPAPAQFEPGDAGCACASEPGRPSAMMMIMTMFMMMLLAVMRRPRAGRRVAPR